MSQNFRINKTDVEILSILQSRASLSKAEIARRVGLTPTAVFERIRKLEEHGVIRGYVAQLDPAPLGRHLLAFVHVTADEAEAAPDTGDRLAAVPGAEEVHRVAGDDGWLLKLRVAGPDELHETLRAEVHSLAGVRSVRTSIVLETIAEHQPLPLEEMDPAPAQIEPIPTLRWAVHAPTWGSRVGKE